MNAPDLPSAAQAVGNDGSDGRNTGAREWLIVTQFKSDRVIYFTDDSDFLPPPDADWCYVSPYVGALPEGMSLRNCWGWRYRGFAFIDARQAGGKRRPQALLDNNKESLRRLLRERIDALRRPYAPSMSMGAEARTLKLLEAQSVLKGEAAGNSVPMLSVAAAALGIPLREMAELIVFRERSSREMLVRSEAVREEIAAAIERATQQAELSVLRDRLMNELASGSAPDEPVRPENTTPNQLMRVPTPSEIEQERLRLRVKLRLKINDLRRPYVSDYLLDDAVLREKAALAEAVLASGGAVPPGLDASALISHAAARGQSLHAAAQEVAAEVKEIKTLALETEKAKDALLSRLSIVTTFAEIDAVAKLIDRLVLDSGAARGAAP